jgi:outer membrane lipoprotein-sorting protein
MADHDTIVLLENEQDQNVISILAKGDQDFVVIDIDGETGLPLKLEIVNRADNSIYYEANFSHWKTNPKFRPELFRFDIPEGAQQLNLLKKMES